MMFKILTLTPFYLEKASEKKVLVVFSVGFCLESGKICKNNNRTCFIALTLAGSLSRCLNTRPYSLMFKQLPRDPANVNA